MTIGAVLGWLQLTELCTESSVVYETLPVCMLGTV